MGERSLRFQSLAPSKALPCAGTVSLLPWVTEHINVLTCGNSRNTSFLLKYLGLSRVPLSLQRRDCPGLPIRPDRQTRAHQQVRGNVHCDRSPSPARLCDQPEKSGSRGPGCCRIARWAPTILLPPELPTYPKNSAMHMPSDCSTHRNHQQPGVPIGDIQYSPSLPREWTAIAPRCLKTHVVRPSSKSLGTQLAGQGHVHSSPPRQGLH